MQIVRRRPSTRRIVASGLSVVLGLVLAGAAAPIAPQVASARTNVVAVTTATAPGCGNAWTTYTTPANTVGAIVSLTGGGGGGGGADSGGGFSGPGGGGATVSTTLTGLSGGQVLSLTVGCGGGGGPQTGTSGQSGQSAFGWGGAGGGGNSHSGAGGGATALCVGNSACDTILAVAGGGGGGGATWRCCAGQNPTGGTAGSSAVTGANGVSGTNGGSASGTGGAGAGATQSGPGSNGGGGCNGAAGNGRNGGQGGGSNDCVGGGGGGGGYFGGGGAGGGNGTLSEAGGAGGGGSSYAASGSPTYSSSTTRSQACGRIREQCGTRSTPGLGGANAPTNAHGFAGEAGTATITWVVNDAPTGAGQTLTANKGTPLAVTLAASDPDGDGASCVIVGSPSKGALGGSGCARTYTANGNQANGPDTFTYRVQDGLGASSPTYTITLNITNRPPTGAAQTLNATKGVGLPITLATSDPDGDTTLTCSTSTPGKGSLTGSGCARTYTAGADTSGSDSFTYTVADAYGGSNTYTVTLNIQNRAPTSANQGVTVTAGQTTPIALGGSDPDGDTTTCATSTPSGGTLSGGTSCSRTYTAPAAAGTYSFTYTRSDAYSGTSAPATVTVEVQIPDVAITKSHVGTFDAGTQGTYTIGVANVGSAATVGTVTVVDDLPAGMTYASSAVTGSGFTCAPQSSGTHVECTRTAALAAGASVSFTITVAVAEGASSGDNTATVSATPDHSSANDTAVDPTDVNLRPQAAAVSASTPVDAPVAVTLAGSDPEGGALTYTVGTPSSGTLDGTAPDLTFTPAPGSDADVTFTYTVTDPNGHTSFAATVTIAVIRPGTRGRVTSDGDGAGLEGITVRLYQDGVGFTAHTAETDAQGYWDLGDQVPAGSYRVIYRDPAQDRVDEWYSDSLLRSTSTALAVGPGAEVVADAGLAKGSRIDVTITNPGSFTVALYNTGPVGASAYRSVAGVTGSTSLRGLPAGTYYVSVADPTGALVTRWSGNQTDRAAAVAITLGTDKVVSRGFTLPSPVSIAGTVIDSEGPIEGVTVQAYEASTATFVKSAKTTAAGTYAIKGLPTGGYKLVFRDTSGAHPIVWHGGGEVITSGAVIPVSGTTVQTVDGELPRAATVTGTVLGGPTGTTPLAGAKVTLYRNGVAVKTFVADAAGVYTATGLAAGPYTVLFMATGHRTEYNLDRTRKADADPITVVEGDVLTVDATLTAS